MKHYRTLSWVYLLADDIYYAHISALFIARQCQYDIFLYNFGVYKIMFEYYQWRGKHISNPTLNI